MAKLGKSQREKDLVRVASVALFSREGKVLFGKRTDSGKWCMPGGHLNPDEKPLKGALRELLEETGLKPDPDSVEYLGSAEIPGKNLVVYSFRAEYLGTQKPSGEDDPDEECSEYRWVAPDELPSPLHNTKDVTLQLLGLQEKTLDLDFADDEPLEKAEGWKAAFRHKVHGQVVLTGQQHDMYALPGAHELYDPMHPERWEDDVAQLAQQWEDGFVGPQGNFLPHAEATKLNKVSLTPEHVAQNIDLDDVMPEGDATYRHTEDLGGGLFHHVFSHRSDPTSFYHFVSRNSNPRDYGSALSGAVVGSWSGVDELNDQFGDDRGYNLPWKSGERFATLQVAATRPDARRQGYGSALWQGVLRYHKRLATDEEVSRNASRAFEKLLKQPGVRGETTYNPGELHWVELVNTPDSLSKGMGSTLAALAAGAALSTNPQPAKLPQQPAAHVQTVAPRWTPKGLHPELHPIAQLESSFGRNVNHKPHRAGSFQTAFGAVGLKPSTAHEEYTKRPEIQKKYPGLLDPADFEAKFKADPEFYNTVASAHWNRLRSLTPNPARAAYSWRFGLYAQKKATDEQVADAEYVQKFLEMLRNDRKVQKSESLEKMALRSIKPGKMMGQPEQTGDETSPEQTTKWDYSHVLSPEQRQAGYKISVMVSTQTPKGMKPYHRMTAFLEHPSTPGQAPNNHAGTVEGTVNGAPSVATIWSSEVHPMHRRKGLGLSLYEAFYRHAMQLGARRAVGGEHSTSAHGVHEALSNKHGLNYEPDYETYPEEEDSELFDPSDPDARYDENGAKYPDLGEPFDGAYRGYNYALKSEDLDKMALSDVPVGKQADLLEPKQTYRSYDYSHVLPKNLRNEGYTLEVEHTPLRGVPGYTNLSAVIHHPAAKARHVGGVSGWVSQHQNAHAGQIVATLKDAHIIDGHRGKGLGSAAYEAFLAHARNQLKATMVRGGDHSSMASRVHVSVARKHGLPYKPVPNEWAAGNRSGPYDKKLQPYEYALKSEPKG